MHKTSLYCLAFCLATGMALAGNATVNIKGDAPQGTDGFVIRAAQIHYQTSDLSTAEGRADLAGRINTIAKHICTVDPNSVFRNKRRIAQCVSKADKDAISDLHLSDADSAAMLASVK